jgi:hypothetical protein
LPSRFSFCPLFDGVGPLDPGRMHEDPDPRDASRLMVLDDDGVERI